jgi:hypothetical protein
VSGTEDALFLAFVRKTYLIGWIYYYARFLWIKGACVGKGTYQLATHTFCAFVSICIDIHLFHIKKIPLLSRCHLSITTIYEPPFTTDIDPPG